MKAEVFNRYTFTDESSLRQAAEQDIHFFNNERFLERSENRTPMAIRLAALCAETPAQYPISENKRIQKYKTQSAA